MIVHNLCPDRRGPLEPDRRPGHGQRDHRRAHGDSRCAPLTPEKKKEQERPGEQLQRDNGSGGDAGYDRAVPEPPHHGGSEGHEDDEVAGLDGLHHRAAAERGQEAARVPHPGQPQRAEDHRDGEHDRNRLDPTPESSVRGATATAATGG